MEIIDCTIGQPIEIGEEIVITVLEVLSSSKVCLQIETVPHITIEEFEQEKTQA